MPPSERLRAKGVSTEKFDRAVRKIKAKGKVKNPYAVATSAFNKQKGLRPLKKSRAVKGHR